MEKYTFNFQIGDIVFFKKTISISKISRGNSFGSRIKDITTLPVKENELPHYFRRVELEESNTQKPLTTRGSKLFYMRNKFPNYYLKLDRYKSFDEYMGKFSGKTRSTLNRKFRNALNHGLTFKKYDQIEEVDEFHQFACSVGEKTYQHKLFNSSIPSDENFKQRVKSLAAENCFLGFILFHDNVPIAYLYCPIIGSSYIYSYLGYLKAFSDYSPGTVLQMAMLKHIYENPTHATTFDFTEGEGKHKETFATDKAWCCNCLVLNDTFPNKLLVRAHITVDHSSSMLGRILDKYNLREKIKKIIRNAATK